MNKADTVFLAVFVSVIIFVSLSYVFFPSSSCAGNYQVNAERMIEYDYKMDHSKTKVDK